MADPVTSAAEAIWVTIPLRIQRRYTSTRGIVGDGYQIALIPPLGLASMIIVPIAYFLIGAFGIGYQEIYSESLVFMGSIILLGAFSGQLGLVALLSFSVADFALAHRQWTYGQTNLIEGLIRNRMPLVISYLLLGVAVLLIPRIGKNIVLGIGRWRRLSVDVAWLITTPIVLIVSWIGLRTWAALSPTLIRPYFVWRGDLPTVDAIEVFQNRAEALVACGVAATLARQLLVGLCIFVPWLSRRLRAMENRGYEHLSKDDRLDAPSPPTRAGLLFGDLASSLLATIVLSGILETRLLWFSFFAVFLVIRLLRSGTVRIPALEAWKGIANRIPVVVRLGIVWLSAIVYRSVLSNNAIGSYRSMAFIVLAGVVVGFLIFPGQPRPRPTKPARRGAPPAPTIGGVHG